jgi:hypothetical protein
MFQFQGGTKGETQGAGVEFEPHSESGKRWPGKKIYRDAG